MRRIYFLVPDHDTTKTIVDELLLARIEERHMHIAASDHHALTEANLPEANLLQESDFVPAVERGLAIGGATGILAGVAAVRADPLLAVWFEPDNMAIPLALSQNSELLQAMSAGLVDQLDTTGLTVDDAQRRGAWLLRCIVSLLAMPGPDEAEERLMVEAFVVPVLVAEPQPERSSR